jgi:hypothetical protein
VLRLPVLDEQVEGMTRENCSLRVGVTNIRKPPQAGLQRTAHLPAIGDSLAKRFAKRWQCIGWDDANARAALASATKATAALRALRLAPLRRSIRRRAP